MAQSDKGLVIAAICRALADGSPEKAEALVRRDYPFAPLPVMARKFNHLIYTHAYSCATGSLTVTLEID